jgi:DNA-binding NarL/FixJ family response regulator
MPIISRLTPRELKIVRALCAGATNREIANGLGLREQTVKNRLSVIYGKLGVRNRVELAIHAERRPPVERDDDC